MANIEKKAYELTMLFDTKKDFSSVLEQIRQDAKRFGGDVIEEKNGGVKRLAYNIYGETQAVFYYMSVKFANALDFEKALYNNNELLHFLLVRNER